MATLTIAIMEVPYESETSTTFMRIVDAALRKGHKVNVFAYEGAVALAMKEQKQHANAVHGLTLEQQDHPTTSKWIEGLFKIADGRLAWVNCGLCADERGVITIVDGPKRGSPGDFYKWHSEGDNTLVIGKK